MICFVPVLARTIALIWSRLQSGMYDRELHAYSQFEAPQCFESKLLIDAS